MKKVLSEIWKDPVWSIIIASGIIFIATRITIYFWSSIKQFFFKYSFISKKNKDVDNTTQFMPNYFIEKEKIENVADESVKLKEEQNINNLLIIRTTPTVFFHDRVCKAFPGVSSYKWFNDPYEAIERLSILLKEPVCFNRSDGYGAYIDPVWMFRSGSGSSIKKFEIIDDKHCLINNDEMNVKTIAVVRMGSYYDDFIYVELNADKRTGLYDNEASIKKYIKDADIYTEEYGLLNNIPISSQEYDDGFAEINGKLVNAGDAEFRLRYITPYNFIITSKSSPYNTHEFYKNSGYYFEGLLKNEIEFESFLEFMTNFPKNQLDR